MNEKFLEMQKAHSFLMMFAANHSLPQWVEKAMDEGMREFAKLAERCDIEDALAEEMHNAMNSPEVQKIGAIFEDTIQRMTAAAAKTKY